MFQAWFGAWLFRGVLWWRSATSALDRPELSLRYAGSCSGLDRYPVAKLKHLGAGKGTPEKLLHARIIARSLC
jgi:hypothetical protein